MDDVPRVARFQHGVFTAEQAREEGWSTRTVRRRIADRRWVYVAGRGLAAPAASFEARQLAEAARLSLRSVVISHLTAARLHGFPTEGLDDDPGECHVILPRRVRQLPRIRTHLVPLPAADVEPGPGELWVTDRRRTALDCLGAVPFGPALDLWAWLATRRVLEPGDLAAAAKARPGRHGTPQLRRLHDVVSGGAVSQAEFRLHELLRRAGLRGWTANAAVAGCVVDVLFARAGVVIEVDGRRAHSSAEAFERDRRRQNALILAGYRVLRFTWLDLTTRPGEVVRSIRAALGRAR